MTSISCPGEGPCFHLGQGQLIRCDFWLFFDCFSDDFRLTLAYFDAQARGSGADWEGYRSHGAYCLCHPVREHRFYCDTQHG